MARARVGWRKSATGVERAELRLRRAPNGAGTSLPAPEAPRERRAYEFHDPQGRHARAWWQGGAWRVEADDPAFQQRIAHALGQPISVWETAVWNDGVPSCAPVQVAPGDPRYLRGLPMAWGQLPLDDVDIEVVSRGGDEG